MNQLMIKLADGGCRLIEYDGNSGLLFLHKIGFISSGIAYKQLDEVLERWIKIVKREGKVIVSGFQSTVEKTVLNLALKENIPVIVAKETCLTENIPDFLYEPYKRGAVTFISIFTSQVKCPSAATGYLRNKLVIDLCPDVTIGSVRPKGTVAALILENSDKKFLNLDDIIYNKRS